MYLEFYDLKVKPFENTPDPVFLFPSKNHREVLASLRYGVESAKGLILVSGDIGTGKTTLIRAFLKQIDPTCPILNIIHPRLKFNEIIKHLAKKLSVSFRGKDNFEVFESLTSRLEKFDQAGKRVVLIIDEAHLISEETLEQIRLLSNIENDRNKLIQIILVGQTEIYNMIQQPSLRMLKQRIMINRRLDPLNQKETENYINHRLKVAGRQSRLFNRRAITSIWRKSKGVPRLINHICDNALLIGFALEAPIIGVKVINEVAADMDLKTKNKMDFSVPQLRIFKPFAAGFSAISLLGILGYAFWMNSFNLRGNFRSAAVSPVPAVYPVMKEIDIQEKLSAMVAPKTDQEQISTKNASPSVSQVLIEPNYQEDLDIKAVSLAVQKKLSENNAAPQNLLTKQTPEKSSVMQNDIDAEETESKIKPADQKNHKSSVEETRKAQLNKQKKQLAQRVVKPNDTLFKIAREVYGYANSTIVDLVQMANPNISNVNRINVGQKIQLPLIEKEDLITTDGKGGYKIHYGSFYSLKDTQRCLKKLSGDKRDCSFIFTRQQDNEVYRVYLGSFKTYGDAQKVSRELKFKYIAFQ